jgi:hypothetical protein
VGEPLRRPPAFALLASLAMFALGATTGGALVALQERLYDTARAVVVKYPEVHGFAGVEVIDQQRIAEVVEQSNNALRMLHVHGLGLGMLILLVSIVIVNLPLTERVQRAGCALVALGALYPPGWLVLGVLIPAWGVNALRAPVEWGLFAPFGGAAIIAIWMALVLAVGASRKRAATGPAPTPHGDGLPDARTSPAGVKR